MPTILYEWPADKPLPPDAIDASMDMIDDDGPNPWEYDIGVEDPPGMVLKNRPAHELAAKAKAANKKRR